MFRKIIIAAAFFLAAGLIFIIGFIPKINTFSPASNDTLSLEENHKCSFPIIAVGDLQRTSAWEYLAGRESNDRERREIIHNISRQKPGSVVLLGDMVFEGDNIDHWRYFDSLIIPIKELHIPLFPVIGNHEYWGKNRIALQYLAERFPELNRSHWYTEICDSIALIFLDSNDLEYSDEQWQQQIDWFKNKLLIYDSDPSIEGILVFAHHPPYTNSLITGDELQVQRGFLPAFYESDKTLAFITGHVHTYERFIERKKTFIVSGGGGGPRVKLKTGSGAHNDYYNSPSPRPFNYLIINKLNGGIEFTVRGVKKGNSYFFTLDQFTLPFSKGNKSG